MKLYFLMNIKDGDFLTMQKEMSLNTGVYYNQYYCHIFIYIFIVRKSQVISAFSQK